MPERCQRPPHLAERRVLAADDATSPMPMSSNHRIQSIALPPTPTASAAGTRDRGRQHVENQIRVGVQDREVVVDNAILELLRKDW